VALEDHDYVYNISYPAIKIIDKYVNHFESDILGFSVLPGRIFFLSTHKNMIQFPIF